MARHRHALLAGLVSAAILLPPDPAAAGAIVAPPSAGGSPVLHDGPCLHPAERAAIDEAIVESRARLRAEGRLPAARATAGSGSFDWALRPVDSYTDHGYHGVSNFVDQDPSYPDQLLDYECGDRTYDLSSGYNHQGTDMFLWPFSWNMMDAEVIEIVAAADGVIIHKSDGYDDRSCGLGGGAWNAVYLEHADGSVTWYGHMQTASTTSNPVGASVVAGEYLGRVGSSGSSTGPHLHFEVHDAYDDLVDPYAGPCNGLNPSTWWTEQRPYYDSAINAIRTHAAPPEFPACPEGEITNESVSFERGERIYFATYYRDQLAGQVTDYMVHAPGGELYWEWDHASSAAHYAASYWYFWLTIPADAPEGQWTYRIAYEGQTCESTFWVGEILEVAGAGRSPGAAPPAWRCSTSSAARFARSPRVSTPAARTRWAGTGSRQAGRGPPRASTSCASRSPMSRRRAGSSSGREPGGRGGPDLRRSPARSGHRQRCRAPRAATRRSVSAATGAPPSPARRFTCSPRSATRSKRASSPRPVRMSLYRPRRAAVSPMSKRERSTPG